MAGATSGPHLRCIYAGGRVPVRAILLQKGGAGQALWQLLLISPGKLAGLHVGQVASPCKKIRPSAFQL